MPSFPPFLLSFWWNCLAQASQNSWRSGFIHPNQGTAAIPALLEHTRPGDPEAAGRASRSEAPPSGGPSRKAPAATGLRSWTVEIPDSGAGRWEPTGIPAPCRGPTSLRGGGEGPRVCAPVALPVPARLPAHSGPPSPPSQLLPHPPFLECGCLF